jgi:ATP adenylyltransferase
MDSIFAPWRIEWVERQDPEETIEGCVFCELPKQDSDRANRIVARGEDAFVILNNYPYNPGHAMVVPDEHTGKYQSLDEDVLLGHARLVQQTIDALESAMHPHGINTGLNLGGPAAGGSIGDHLHTHVVPRWGGDTNFMPVISDTKVIVEAIEDTYDRLRDAFAELDGATDPGPDQAVEL